MATELENHPTKVAMQTVGATGWTPGKHYLPPLTSRPTAT